jgi:hypothetical protein
VELQPQGITGEKMEKNRDFALTNEIVYNEAGTFPMISAEMAG